MTAGILYNAQLPPTDVNQLPQLLPNHDPALLVVALLESPALFSLGCVAEGRIVACNSEFIMNEAYSVRLFCEQFECRWYRQPGESAGNACVIAEHVPVADANYSELPYIGKHAHQYLLWGKRLSNSNEPVLAEHRIGSITLPLPWSALKVSAGSDRVCIRAVEYFGAVNGADADGNVSVIDERLLSIGLDQH